MMTGRNGQSLAHFFHQLRELSAKKICKVSTPVECKILVEEIHCHLLLAFICGTREPVANN
jgi:hypothetical protein